MTTCSAGQQPRDYAKSAAASGSGAARRRREQAERAQRRHVGWLVKLMQAGSHHTFRTSASTAERADLLQKVSHLEAQVRQLQEQLAALTGSLAVSVPSEPPDAEPLQDLPVQRSEVRRLDERPSVVRQRLVELEARVKEKEVQASEPQPRVQLPTSSSSSAALATTSAGGYLLNSEDKAAGEPGRGINTGTSVPADRRAGEERPLWDPSGAEGGQLFFLRNSWQAAGQPVPWAEWLSSTRLL